ncbi:glycosyltransferase family 4 protein [Tenacibaculum jejuense]|uniref:Glycosyl transferase, group 4 family protein n=1 Tax=Tenacibaculum jejuense TaxID=584609 RepID=A0A238UEU9_9FLAO|nr:glycosyltransferase family 4 protein [Tenacibaculum jejuense]SNR17108.1 Glycosyl transferase, group 4 family protein [Tenacibaculum jejuense]
MNSKKQHILFLCGWFPSRVLPNNGDFIERHAKAVQLYHNVSVIHIITDSNCKKNIEIVSSKNVHIAYIKPSKNKIVKAFRFYQAFRLLLQKIGNFDIVHLNELFPFGMLALYLKWFKKKKFIVSEHWTGYHKPLSEKISHTTLKLSKIIAKQAQYICPVSKDLQSSMEQLGLKGNYTVIPNVVNTNIFKPTIKSDKKYTILHISNMVDSHKNVSGIIQAIKNFELQKIPFELVLVGENSDQYQLISNELKITDRITFIDHVSHEEVKRQMQQADVFVLFSNYENQPCVILESFACGTPVISTNVGGVSEFFPKDHGILIESKNENQLVKALVDIYHNKEKIDSTVLHNYTKQNFNYETIGKRFSELYKTCIS